MSTYEPTKGFRLTHIGLRVADISQSIEFYSGVFGMKELGRINLDASTIVFLGYPDSASPNATLFSREGVLELVSANKSNESNTQPPTHSHSRFIKLAFSVPDLDTATNYIKSHNVKFVKHIGETRGSAEVAAFLGIEAPDKGFDKLFL